MTEITTHSKDVVVAAPDAIAFIVWAVETLAEVLGVEIDPVEVRSMARRGLEGHTQIDRSELHKVLIATLDQSHLTAIDCRDLAESLSHTDLPLIAIGNSGVAAISRADGRFEIRRQGQPASWVNKGDAFDAMRNAGAPWVSAVPSVPLQTLSHPHATPFARLKALLRLERDDLSIVLIYAAAVGLLTLATPIAVQSLVGSVAFGTMLQPIVVLSLLLLAALSFQGALKALQARVVETIQQRIFVRTALDLSWRLPRLKPELAEEGFGPQSVNHFFEVVAVQKSASVLLTDGVATVLQLAIGLLVLGFYHPALLAFDIVLIAMASLVVFVPIKWGLSSSIQESYAKYDVAAWLQELSLPGSTFGGVSGAMLAQDRADALTRRYLKARETHFGVVFGQTLGTLALQIFASAALLGLGGWLVIERELTFGQLVGAELIVASVASAVSKAGKLLDNLYDLLTGLDKLGHLIDLPIERPQQAERIAGTGGVKVELISASDGKLPPISLIIEPHERLAVVAPYGHPIVDWLGALRVPSEGIISINGVETNRARSPALRDQIAVIRPNELWAGTVFENVAVGRAEITAPIAREVLETVGLLNEVRRLPNGIDTPLFHGGAPLSRSQALRLLIARAIAANPRLLIVDVSIEGFSQTEREMVIDALTSVNAPWTLVAMVNGADRALARSCSRVIRLDELSTESVS